MESFGQSVRPTSLFSKYIFSIGCVNICNTSRVVTSEDGQDLDPQDEEGVTRVSHIYIYMYIIYIL